MNLIIWLWNPWEKYKYTKHNVWFLFLDYFSSKNNFENFKLESKFKAQISNWIYFWKKTILLKPQTFMNLSWESIRKIVDFYKIDLNNIIVIYDDISMDFWKIRFRSTWSAGWHNWIKNIISHFSDNFKRIKIWIWYNDNYEISDWVLSKFRNEELEQLEDEIYKNIEKKLIENF